MKITGDTKVLGIFGYPVRHTLSPLMQNAALEAMGLDYVYLPFEVRPEELKSAVKGIKALGIHGVNVTVPHKENVVLFLDEITDEAALIGSVNTIENRNGLLIGHNTDAMGYIRSLSNDAGFGPKGKKILVIGAGGAARGVIAGLFTAGASKIIIANRTMEKANRIEKDFKHTHKKTAIETVHLSSLKDPDILSSVDLIVNTTSMGLEGKAPDIDFASTATHVLISDISYKPPLTPFLKEAQEYGRNTLGGIGMLIYQGAISFEIWTSNEAPIKAMKRALSF